MVRERHALDERKYPSDFIILQSTFRKGVYYFLLSEGLLLTDAVQQSAH